MTAPHCPACDIRQQLLAHRDATYADWGDARGVLNFAAVLAQRACPEWRPIDRDHPPEEATT